MINTVLKTVSKYEMLKDVEEVTVALSGGADSMALLNILCELKEQFNIKVSAAHLNHSLRGADADADQRVAEEFCRQKGVKIFSEKIDVNLAAEQSGESVETAARKIRYEFLERVSNGVIATAHTASDNLETVLFNIARGSGVKGVCGIPPVRGRIIRPLIGCTREEVENYCAENGIKYCTDKTNFSDCYSRNNIRLNAVPVLKKVNENAERNAWRMSEILRQNFDFIDCEIQKAYKDAFCDNKISVEKLLSLHSAIASGVIKKFCADITGEQPEAVHISAIEKICREKTGAVGLKNNFIANLEGNQLIIRSIDGKKENTLYDYTLNTELPFQKYSEFKFSALTREKFEEIVNFDKTRYLFAIDCDTIVGKLRVRNRIGGDKITLIKRRVTKTLKKLFNEQKLPSRDSIAVLSDDSGVVWVDGIGVNNKNRVTKDTRNIIYIEKMG